MLQPRIIPVLLLQNDAVVKTMRFSKPKYIGDPINTVNLYNSFEVDELIVLDINASITKKINFSLVEQLCAETFMPLTYGGGVNCIEDMQLLFNLGVEKIVLGTSAYMNQNLIRKSSDIFGSQAIVCSVDYKRSIFGRHNAYVKNGTIKIKSCIEQYIDKIINLGCGEILLQSIDRDGMMNDYDYEFVKKITDRISIPIIAIGGAKSRLCISKIIHNSNASGAGASSIFIYQNEERGILINFPEEEEIKKLLYKEPVHG